MTKHHITKKSDLRVLDPLEPNYDYPGAKETHYNYDTFNKLR